MAKAEALNGLGFLSGGCKFSCQPYVSCVQDAASDLYGMVVMSPTNYTRRAQPKYETYGVPTEFTCVPPTIKAPFNRTEFDAFL